MLDAAFWGLIQGLTEFLPISSSGHLVLVPALLGREGPDLATSAVLHLGTLVAVLAYFRHDVGQIVRFTPSGRRLLRLLIIGTIPAAILGLLFEGTLDRLNETPRAVAVALFLTGLVLFATRWLPLGNRAVADSRDVDAVTLGFGQALALIPGVSRSGTTISAGLASKFERAEAARYSFLLGIPAIAGAGSLQFIRLIDEGGGVPGETLVGVAVAAVSGYVAIAFLLRVIRTTGLVPFGVYCLGAGILAFALV
jgi:undecaprenyl-diphosphatase